MITGCVRLWLSLLLLPLAACAPRGTDTNLPPGSLPAYAHNDYQNRHPLWEALNLGYSGVEADIFLVDGKLLVAHDRKKVRADRALKALYLEPLRRIVADSGRVCTNGETFILNIEAKEEGPETFAALHEVLLEYQDMLTRVKDGHEIPGPVQVILVGAQPSWSDLAAMPVRCVAVQSYFADLPADHANIPAHLLRLVTVQYPQYFQWQGEGPVPEDFQHDLAAMVAARDAVPGRLLRVFKVPRSRAVYQALLAGGVDLIGTKSLGRTARLLRPDQPF